MYALYADVIIIIFLFIIGFSIVINVNKNERLERNLIISLPLGIGIWSIIWIFCGILIEISFNAGNYHITQVSLIISSAVSIFALFRQRYYFNNNKTVLKIASVIIFILFLITLFHSFKTAIIFGDSFAFITWTFDLFELSGQGYPLIGLSLSNLSAIILPDYYSYVIHPLLNLCLTALIFDATLISNGNSALWKRIAVPVVVTSLFASNNNFIHHSFYVNFHGLSAIFILAAALSIGEKVNTMNKAFLILLLSMLMLTRMEGFIISITMLIMFNSSDIAEGKFVKKESYIYLTISSLYIIFLTAALRDSEYFTSDKYLLVWSVFLLYTIFNKSIFSRTMITGGLFLLGLFYIFNTEHMQTSIRNYFNNCFNINFWGFTNYALLIIVTFLMIIEFKYKIKNIKIDLLIRLFAVCIIVTLLMSGFRPPYKVGWFDSGNRMYFQYLPLAIVWLGYIISDLRKLIIDNNQRTDKVSERSS